MGRASETMEMVQEDETGKHVESSTSFGIL